MARLLLALLALFLVAAAPAPVLAPNAEARWVDFAPTPVGQIRFTATVDGRAVAAILDTGVSHSVLARASAAVTRTRLRPGGEAVAVGGSVAVERMRVARIEVGALARDGGELLVADLPAAAAGGEPVELLVGQDLVGDLALDIDYPRRRFRLLRSGRLPFAGDTAPLAAMPGRGLPLTALTLGATRLSPVLVDTGDGNEATLGPAARAALPDTTTAGAIRGMAGLVATEVAVAPAIGLGEATAREVRVHVESPEGFAGRLGLAGRIGAGLLSRYRVLIDPRAGRMVLAAPAPILALTDIGQP